MRADPITFLRLNNSVYVPVVADSSGRGGVVGKTFLLNSSDGHGGVMAAVVVVVLRLGVVQGAVQQQGQQQQAEPHAPGQDDGHPLHVEDQVVRERGR